MQVFGQWETAFKPGNIRQEGGSLSPRTEMKHKNKRSMERRRAIQLLSSPLSSFFNHNHHRKFITELGYAILRFLDFPIDG